MQNRDETSSILASCFDAYERLLPTLSDQQWATPSLCPAWDVRGAATHVVGIEYALQGWKPDAEAGPPPFERLAEFETEMAGASAGAFTERVVDVLASRRADLAAMTDDEFAMAMMTPVGPGTYERFMRVRTFDLWVHERDITTPLGLETDDSGPAAEVALDEVEASIGYIAGKCIGLEEGMGIRFEVHGPVEREINVKVDGRAAKVDSLTDPDAVIRADSLTFIQLACGRIDPSDSIEQGKISWTGDAAWGERAARSLRFTR